MGTFGLFAGFATVGIVFYGLWIWLDMELRLKKDKKEEDD